MRGDSYEGRERRKFRRLDLHYPVRIETPAKGDVDAGLVADGVTVNLSFGGALVGVSDVTAAQGAMPVNVRFVGKGHAFPEALPAVVWRTEDGDEAGKVAVEFDAPLLAYEGAVEIADRLEWLRDMGGDDFVRELVELFLDGVPTALRRARDSQHAGDLGAVAQIARSLKSSAGNIGAVNLYEVARRAEHAARKGDAGAAARHVNALQGYFDAIKVQLEEAV